MPEFALCLVRHLRALPPHAVAGECEARGLDALFVPENSHVPVDRSRTPKRIEDVAWLAGFHDPFVTLAACAATTQRIWLGTSVCLLTQREPVATARAIADLDRLSQGRTVLGVAGGFIREAMEHHGCAFEHRWKIVRERVLAMRTIWTQPAPAFTGEFVEFGPLAAPARPHRTGGPPVWIGSNSRWVPGRVADYADGWLARPALYDGDPIADLRLACSKRGRAFDTLTVALMDAPLDLDASRRRLDEGYGVLVWFLGGDTRDAQLRALDHVAELAQRLRERHPAGN